MKLSEQGEVGDDTKSGEGVTQRGKSIRFNGLRHLRGRGQAVRLFHEFPFREAAGAGQGGEATHQERFQDLGQRAEARGGFGVQNGT